MLSFIVPAYNEEFELPSTLEAIRSAANGRAHEIIVADDASTDRTSAIGREAGAKVVFIDRRQIAAARNAGARAAGGDVLFFVDADTRI
ncbi:MAG TPA: glycosyltransferase, partial [Chthoniobacterales bacterium]|nr:glycosyltransferase [Chthoniobacterales bacterium]